MRHATSGASPRREKSNFCCCCCIDFPVRDPDIPLEILRRQQRLQAVPCLLNLLRRLLLQLLSFVLLFLLPSLLRTLQLQLLLLSLFT